MGSCKNRTSSSSSSSSSSRRSGWLGWLAENPSEPFLPRISCYHEKAKFDDKMIFFLLIISIFCLVPVLEIDMSRAAWSNSCIECRI
jgi:hypothetical protein